tara:strand:+ start:1381 stop:2043 length:663 start_codon:yes stop_codon:yes gene_type:complete
VNINKYKTIIFDCDGVILNSNKIKTQAFKTATNKYGESYSNKLINYHLLNGGISRYEKFKYFLKNIFPIDSSIKRDLELHNLLEIYSKESVNGLLNSEITYGLKYFRNHTKGIPWLIVSGGDQGELNYVFEIKEIIQYFDGGIFGSPDSKGKILSREIENNNIRFPCLFLGDSKLDHQVSSDNGLEFIFVSKWSEFKAHKKYCLDNSIRIISRVYDLLEE